MCLRMCEYACVCRGKSGWVGEGGRVSVSLLKVFHLTYSHLLSPTLTLFDIQYENWKIRETARLIRDAEQREMAALEKADLERRRLMTDEQRISEDKRLGKHTNSYSCPHSYPYSSSSSFFLLFCFLYEFVVLVNCTY